MSMMERLLRLMNDKHASDIYLSANAPAMIRVNGFCTSVNRQILSQDAPRQLLTEILSEEHLQELDQSGELNIAYSIEGAGRFRISAMRQRGTIAVVIRHIRSEIPTLESLSLPLMLNDLVLQKRGLILLAGATGSGKSSTLAALVEHRNESMSGHVLTIEDPIEFVFTNKRCVINQREVGTDTQSMDTALKNALRQAPDVILIGEIRDRETMSAALAYAQSGHLCLSTIHASNSYQALNRIVNFYPAEVRPTLLSDLSSALRAIVSQRLLRSQQGKRVPACEVMLNTKLVSELIEKGDFFGVRDAMEKSMADGSQTFEADIARMIRNNIVDRKEGIANADSATNLMWRMQNDFDLAAKGQSNNKNKASNENEPVLDTEPSFTEIILDITH